MDETLDYKRNKIENFKKQNEELNIHLNYKKHFEKNSSSRKNYIEQKK